MTQSLSNESKRGLYVKSLKQARFWFGNSYLYGLTSTIKQFHKFYIIITKKLKWISNQRFRK